MEENIDGHGKMFELRWQIRKAMRELEAKGYLKRFMLPDRGNVVAVFKSKYRSLPDYYGWKFK
jgi:hypothetical protein